MLFEYEFELAAPIEDVFDLTQDYQLRPVWDSSTPTIYMLEPGPPATGKRVYSRTRNGWEMEFVYLEFDRPHFCVFKLEHGPRLFKYLQGGWRFDAVSKQTTRVTFSYIIHANPAFLTPLLLWLFKRDAKKRIAALSLYVNQHFNKA